MELVHDAVAVGLLVSQGLHAGEEAGGAEVDLLGVRALLGGLAILAPDEAQLFFKSRVVCGSCVLRMWHMLVFYRQRELGMILFCKYLYSSTAGNAHVGRRFHWSVVKRG